MVAFLHGHEKETDECSEVGYLHHVQQSIHIRIQILSISVKINFNKHITFSKVFKNSIRDARTPQPREIFLTPQDIEVLYQYKVQDTFRALSVI